MNIDIDAHRLKPPPDCISKWRVVQTLDDGTHIWQTCYKKGGSGSQDQKVV